MLGRKLSEPLHFDVCPRKRKKNVKESTESFSFEIYFYSGSLCVLNLIILRELVGRVVMGRMLFMGIEGFVVHRKGAIRISFPYFLERD